MKFRVKKFLKELRFYTIMIVVAIVFAVGLRVFVVASIIKVTTGSMEPVVLAGDKIIVTKLIPGARVYKDIRQIRQDGKIRTKRFKGIRKVKHNDVVFFNFPYSGAWDKIDMNLSLFYLKRCVGLPGDTFSIENGIYRVSDSSNSLGDTRRQLELSSKSQEDFKPGIWNCFPFDTVHYKWNIKDFGPLYVPASGSTIVFDTIDEGTRKNDPTLYKNLIEYESDKTLSVRAGLVYLDDERITEYTFKLNYYFVAGDNIFDSQDSRYFGLLPEDCIIGKALLVWRSTDMNSGKIRWDRFFKRIT